MRKIISREDRDRKNKLNQIIIGVILIAVMIFGTLGYAFSGGGDEETSEKIEYKGTEFIQDDSEYWRFNIQGYDFITRYNPLETGDMYFFISLSINDYVNKPLYFVSEFQEPIFEINRNLKSFVSRINEACLDEENCLDDLPIKNCSIDNIIVIREPEDEIKEISQEENCIFITADFGNQTRYADAFLFRVLGF